MILIFFGPPGAGKGTQANLISKKLNIPHLSTGDILRDILKRENDISKKIKKIIDSGKLVSDDILNQIVSDRLNNKDCLNGFILDGYPRTIEQALFIDKLLESKNMKISSIIDIDVNEEVIIKRIKSRSAIEKRIDDGENVIKTRILKYLSETKPLSDHYKKLYPDLYNKVDGTQDIDEISSNIDGITNKWFFISFLKHFLTWLNSQL